MQVGLLMVFQNFEDGASDAQAWARDIQLALLAFGVDMNEARDRFDEAAELIIRGLETGIVEGSDELCAKAPGPRCDRTSTATATCTSRITIPPRRRLFAWTSFAATQAQTKPKLSPILEVMGAAEIVQS